MYAIGNPILVKHGSFAGGVKKVDVTKKDIKNSLFDQQNVVIFENLVDAKKYASALREDPATYKSPADRKRVPGIFEIELKKDVVLKLFSATLTSTDSYTQKESQIALKFYKLSPDDIARVLRVDFNDVDLDNQDFSSSRSSCNII